MLLHCLYLFLSNLFTVQLGLGVSFKSRNVIKSHTHRYFLNHHAVLNVTSSSVFNGQINLKKQGLDERFDFFNAP